MASVLSYLRELNIVTMMLRILLAVLCGGLIGLERERKNRPAGMRTHVLVCVGASIIAIMESLMIADTITLNMNTARPAPKPR